MQIKIVCHELHELTRINLFNLRLVRVILCLAETGENYVTSVKEIEKTEVRKDKKDELLLDSLEIKGYRCFEHLTIEKLGRVNLIVGKNNVGKTALLEALWIWCEGSAWNYVLRTIDKILTRRSEKSPDQLHEDGREYRHLFYNRPQKDFYQFSISNNRPIPRVVEEWEETESTLNKEKKIIAEEMVGVELQISNKSAQIVSNNLGERNQRLFHKDIIIFLLIRAAWMLHLLLKSGMK